MLIAIPLWLVLAAALAGVALLLAALERAYIVALAAESAGGVDGRYMDRVNAAGVTLRGPCNMFDELLRGATAAPSDNRIRKSLPG